MQREIKKAGLCETGLLFNIRVEVIFRRRWSIDLPCTEYPSVSDFTAELSTILGA